MNHQIPPMTEPLGRYWKQPARERILIDDTHAMMTADDFALLAEYSTSRPSGVYPGKMWRAELRPPRDLAHPLQPSRWFLCWYGEVPGRPDLCSNHHREVILVDSASGVTGIGGETVPRQTPGGRS